MELFSNLTDDQTALIGCALALTICGTLMGLSFNLNGTARNRRSQSDGDHPVNPVAGRLGSVTDTNDEPVRKKRAA